MYWWGADRPLVCVGRVSDCTFHDAGSLSGRFHCCAAFGHGDPSLRGPPAAAAARKHSVPALPHELCSELVTVRPAPLRPSRWYLCVLVQLWMHCRTNQRRAAHWKAYLPGQNRIWGNRKKCTCFVLPLPCKYKPSG